MNTSFQEPGWATGKSGCRFPWITLAASLLMLLSKHSARSATVPVNQLVAGRTYAEWLAESWIFFSETPYDSRHPAQDLTGSRALVNQKGPVWHLFPAATKQPITRNISVPDDQYLLVNFGTSSCTTIDAPPYYGGNEAELLACVKALANENLFLEIDGEEISHLEDFQVTSTLFDFTYPDQNVGLVPGGGAGQGIAAGIAVMLEPFTPGTHAIHFRTSDLEVNFSAAVTYRITVYSRPSVDIKVLSGSDKWELSWRVTPGFVLQTAATLALEGSWSDATIMSSLVVDGVQKVTVAKRSPTEYFRLRHR